MLLHVARGALLRHTQRTSHLAQCTIPMLRIMSDGRSTTRCSLRAMMVDNNCIYLVLFANSWLAQLGRSHLPSLGVCCCAIHTLAPPTCITILTTYHRHHLLRCKVAQSSRTAKLLLSLTLSILLKSRCTEHTLCAQKNEGEIERTMCGAPRVRVSVVAGPSSA
jgi:hypothetical protein